MSELARTIRLQLEASGRYGPIEALDPHDGSVQEEAERIIAAALASGKGGDDAIAFLKRAADGKHRIVSTGDLTLHQVAEAMARNMAFVDNDSCLGWVLLPWELTTAKDEQRHAARSEGAKP